MFKQGFMADIIKVMDEKLREFEKRIDDKLDKFRGECKSKIAEEADKVMKDKVMAEIDKKWITSLVHRPTHWIILTCA